MYLPSLTLVMITLFPEQEQVIDKLTTLKTALIVAETGSGKTVMALKKIELILEQSTNKRALYIAPTNILTAQHTESFRKSSVHPIHLIRSGGKIGSLDEPGIYVTTAHYAKILCKQLPSDRYTVIVYDEAHKSISMSSPYVNVADHFTPDFAYGFTASPGKETNLKHILKNLYLSEVIYGSAPNKFTKTTIERPLKNCPFATQNYIIYCTWLKSAFIGLHSALKIPARNVLFYLIKNKNTINSTLKSYDIPLYQYYIYFHLYYCGYLYYYEGYDTFLKYYSKLERYKLDKYKMIRLLLDKNYINTKFKTINDICATHDSTTLIFFQNYDTAMSCKDYLCTTGFDSSQVEVLAGKSKMNAKVRDEIVKRTHENKIKVLLATSVVEEGVDIQGVDQIIFFKPIFNKIRVIQRRGRTGRHKDGVIYILSYINTEEQPPYV